MATQNTNTIITVLVIALVAVGGYAFFNMRDNRNGAERLGDAISELPNGIDNAARELEDRTPAERVTDTVKDATDGTP